MKLGFPRLDIMIAYSCNISCAGCISISDRKRDGVASLDDIAAWCSKWNTYIDPEIITIFGGEPCLHPKLIEVCQTVRLAWPNSVIRLITNGYLLDNFDPSHWFTLGKFEMQVSLHRQDHRLDDGRFRRQEQEVQQTMRRLPDCECVETAVQGRICMCEYQAQYLVQVPQPSMG